MQQPARSAMGNVFHRESFQRAFLASIRRRSLKLADRTSSPPALPNLSSAAATELNELRVWPLGNRGRKDRALRRGIRLNAFVRKSALTRAARLRHRFRPSARSCRGVPTPTVEGGPWPGIMIMISSFWLSNSLFLEDASARLRFPYILFVVPSLPAERASPVKSTFSIWIHQGVGRVPRARRNTCMAKARGRKGSVSLKQHRFPAVSARYPPRTPSAESICAKAGSRPAMMAFHGYG